MGCGNREIARDLTEDGICDIRTVLLSYCITV
jgi:hypothetical protein